ncbi:MAG: hypothetical protein AAGA93_01355 [Actinomycetota bacterium]
MNQWLNRSHPPTLQAAVFLGYLSAFFGLLFGSTSFLLLPVFIGLGVGAFVTANNKRWGYVLLAVCACIVALFDVADLVDSIIRSFPLEIILLFLNRTVFPVALAVAVLHTQSREYQRIWFE